MAMRLRTQNDNVGGWLQKLQNAGRDQRDIEAEQQLATNTYGDQSNVPTFLGMPMQLNIGAMSGTSKKAGSKEKMTGLEDIGEKASVDNVYYQKPDGSYAPIKEIAHPKDSKDAITPAKAVPLFVKQDGAFTPAKTFDSGGTNKDAVLVNAKGLDGDLGFQTATRDELPYFKPGNTDKSVIPDTIGEGWSNEMTVLTTDPAATLNGTSSAAAEARAARIGATRNKELPPLTYQGINQTKTEEAQAREKARVDELNARNAIKYEELISKYPERAPTEQNIKRNAEIRAANAKGDSGEVYHDILNVPSFVNPVRGEAFLGGGRISGIIPQRQEVDLIEKPAEIKPNPIEPIMGPRPIQGTYVPREKTYTPRTPKEKVKLLWFQWDSKNNELTQDNEGANPYRMSDINEAYLQQHHGTEDVKGFTDQAMSNFSKVYKFDPQSTGSLTHLYDLPLTEKAKGYNLAQGVGALFTEANATDGGKYTVADYRRMQSGRAPMSTGYKKAFDSMFVGGDKLSPGWLMNQSERDRLAKHYGSQARGTTDSNIDSQLFDNMMFYANNFLLAGLHGGWNQGAKP